VDRKGIMSENVNGIKYSGGMFCTGVSLVSIKGLELLDWLSGCESAVGSYFSDCGYK
jgi:hypothetical protein